MAHQKNSHTYSIPTMGLHMDNIHAPSVPSGSGGGRSLKGSEDKAMSLSELMSEKQRVEEELSALGSVLDSVSHGHYCSRLFVKD